MLLWWLITGTIIALLSLGLSKKIEGVYLSPASFFFLVFFLHAYVNGYSSALGGAIFFHESLDTLIFFTVCANLLLLVGYFMGVVLYPFKLVEGSPRLIGGTSYYFFAVISLLVVVVLFYYMGSIGLYSSERGALQSSKGSYRYVVALSFLLYTFVPALLISCTFDEENKSRLKRCLAVLVVLTVFLYSASQFGRRLILAVIMIYAIVYHNRGSGVRYSHVIFGIFVFLIITVIAMLRSAKSGLMMLNVEDVGAAYTQVEGGFTGRLMHMVSGVVPGQQVFSNVIYFVDNGEPLRLGATYIDSFLSLAVPNIISGNFNYDTPSVWFKNAFAPGMTDHGFGFSMMAEAYLNFSFFGVFVFLLVGFFIGIVSSLIRKTSSALMCLWGAVVIVGFSMGLREDSNVVFTYCFYFIIPFLMMRGGLSFLLSR